jgi:hypothetical protein
MPSRRAFLTGVLGTVVLFAGCTTEDTSTPSPDPIDTPTATPEPALTPYIEELRWGETTCSTLHDVVVTPEMEDDGLYLYIHSHLSLVEAASITDASVNMAGSGYEVDISVDPDAVGEPCDTSLWYEVVVVLPTPVPSEFTIDVFHDGGFAGTYEFPHDTSSDHHE